MRYTNMDGEELLRYARINYPIGTKFINPVPGSNSIHIQQNTDFEIFSNDNYKSLVINVTKDSNPKNRFCIYYEGKWGEILERVSQPFYEIY